MTSPDNTNDDDLKVDENVDETEVSLIYDIASYPSDLTLSVVHEMWVRKDIIIPDYQRNFVWNIQQASLLIESFLLGLPVPQVFFYVDEENKSEVIDGQQRITSIVYFLDGYFGSESFQGKKQVFRLKGLDKKSAFSEKTYGDLSESYQRKLRSSVLRAINIKQLNPGGAPTSVYHIFERLNTGGTPLKPQEIRNCVFRGEFVRILRRLNQDKNWRTIIGKRTYDRHQKDVELILRIFALNSYFDEYEKPMKEFLNVIMKRDQEGDSAVVTRFERDFVKAAELIIKNLGVQPFHVRGPLNASALDAVFSVFLDSYKRLPDDLGERYSKLLKNETFVATTSYNTSDLSVIKDRFKVTKEILVG